MTTKLHETTNRLKSRGCSSKVLSNGDLVSVSAVTLIELDIVCATICSPSHRRLISVVNGHHCATDSILPVFFDWANGTLELFLNVSRFSRTYISDRIYPFMPINQDGTTSSNRDLIHTQATEQRFSNFSKNVLLR